MKLTLNGELREVAAVATVSDLLGSLRLTEKLVLVERNGNAVPRADFAFTKLVEGDAIEIVRLSAGG
ncbi:MAG: sulfur carrier protein ThiS [Verrucomicrobia bacterium]|nr:sulfur carrier protein ThiS [Verrucomicrobiota bacterium]MBV8641994.1 sulfur carrier protein ThiS [Verrucomicrobiota bacterium]